MPRPGAASAQEAAAQGPAATAVGPAAPVSARGRVAVVQEQAAGALAREPVAEVSALGPVPAALEEAAASVGGPVMEAAESAATATWLPDRPGPEPTGSLPARLRPHGARLRGRAPRPGRRFRESR